MAENLKSLEHDSLEDERRAPAMHLKFEPTEKELRLKDAKERMKLREDEGWLSVENPAIWTRL